MYDYNCMACGWVGGGIEDETTFYLPPHCKRMTATTYKYIHTYIHIHIYIYTHRKFIYNIHKLTGLVVADGGKDVVEGADHGAAVFWMCGK